ncbi:tRNA methyltransferase complex GCD14 subunit, partial [Glonium stellatum]
PSPFLDPGPTSSANTLALLHLKRDLLIPTILSESSTHSDTDYAEGKVTNTRFGSFPHSTLLNQPWGTQILASNVDTGSRGSKGKKRKREDGETPKEIEEDGEEFKGGRNQAATAASSGFVHLLPPTPEAWTLSLPHRTQVVYTPDYSYILQRLRARPGDRIIEAGAGSGSFTHAAARAVFNGYPDADNEGNAAQNGTVTKSKKKRKYGSVYSFEFHAPRAEQLQAEITEHGLNPIVRITNRDVYEDGFCLPASPGAPAEPEADCVFLDLPAPWLALKHLTRTPLSPSTLRSVDSTSSPSTPNPLQAQTTVEMTSFRSPLNPSTPTRICAFSPCIEQVQRTVNTLRQLGWVEIDMVEILHRRLDVRRERVGLQEEGLRGANASAATVQEAVQRLREVEGRFKAFHELQKEDASSVQGNGKEAAEEAVEGAEVAKKNNKGKGKGKGKSNVKAEADTAYLSRQQRLENLKAAASERDLFKEGRLLHRTEPELKTHTSYLVFAVLPRVWAKEDEENCRRKW